jgi:hypothetical protein
MRCSERRHRIAVAIGAPCGRRRGAWVVRSNARFVLLTRSSLLAAPQIRVVGPYRASLSRTDVQTIFQLAQTIERRYYSRMTLNAVAPDEVWVGTVSQVQRGSMWYDYSAVRRGGRWERGRYTPPPMD